MSLPKLNVSVHEAKLPSTNKVIKFRPFLVKEEKILLTAMEDGEQSSMMNAVKKIIKNCVQSKIDVDKLPIFDIEYIFLKLRAKSVGEKSNINLKCQECETQNEVEIDMEKIEVFKPKDHNRKIMINDEVGVMMSYPVITTAGVDEQDGMKIVQDCIEMIFNGEETHERGSYTEKELNDFIESMDSKQFGKIKNFFDTMPKLQHSIEFNCVSCGKENFIMLEGLDSFFE